MLKKVYYKIFAKEKLIIEHLSGPVGWNDLVKMKSKEVEEPDYNPNFNVITDIRKAILDLNNLDEVNKYVEFLNNNEKSVGNRKTAILTDSSEQVIHSEILRVMKNDLPINIKTVSTLEAVFTWVGLTPQAALEIERFLENFSSEFYMISSN